MKKLLAVAILRGRSGSLAVAALVAQLGSFVRPREELRNRIRPLVRRDRRPERRRQPGSCDRKPQREKNRLRAPEQGSGSFQAKHDYAVRRFPASVAL